MTLEVWLWMIAWFVISETLFVIFLPYGGTEDWGLFKVLCFLIGGVIVWGQFMIMGGLGFNGIKYINLLYELIVIGCIGLIVFLNWWIVRFFKKKELKKEKKKK